MECVVTAKMAEVSQFQPAFSRVCSGVFVAFKHPEERPGKPP